MQEARGKMTSQCRSVRCVLYLAAGIWLCANLWWQNPLVGSLNYPLGGMWQNHLGGMSKAQAVLDWFVVVGNPIMFGILGWAAGRHRSRFLGVFAPAVIIAVWFLCPILWHMTHPGGWVIIRYLFASKGILHRLWNYSLTRVRPHYVLYAAANIAVYGTLFWLGWLSSRKLGTAVIDTD